MRRKLQHDRALTLAQLRPHHHAPIREFQRDAMKPRIVNVDLAEDRSLERGFLHLRTKPDRRSESNLLVISNLSSGEASVRRGRLFGRRKTRRCGPEISSRQLVADLCGARPHMLQAIVAHAEELL